MRIAVISDIHGNCVALDAVLDDIRQTGVDQIVCLGDAVQGGPQPVEVAAQLRELGCPVVMGNADNWLLTGVANDAERISEERRVRLDTVRAWQLTRLTTSDLDFIRTFQPTLQIPLDDGRTLLCYHGSPQSFDHIILPQTPDDEVRGYLQPKEQMIYTGGHTHIQFIRHFGRTFHFNPGSVGVAYRHDQPDDHFRLDPWAEYALLSSTSGALSLEFRRIGFDVQELISVYKASGRPFADSSIADYGERP
jgi:predicted phosphodiesterase